jgi:hypothetical protein
MTPARRSRRLGQIVAAVTVELDDLDDSNDIALVVGAGASHYVPVRRRGIINHCQPLPDPFPRRNNFQK